MAKKAVKRVRKKTRSKVKHSVRQHIIDKQNQQQSAIPDVIQKPIHPTLPPQLLAGSLRSQMMMRAGLGGIGGMPMMPLGGSQSNIKFEKMRAQTNQIEAENNQAKAQLEALRAEKEAELKQKEDLKKEKSNMKKEMRRKEFEITRMQKELDLKTEQEAKMEQLAQRSFELQRQQMELNGDSDIQRQIAMNSSAEAYNEQLKYNLAQAKIKIAENNEYNKYLEIDSKNRELKQELEALDKIQKSDEYVNAIKNKVLATQERQILEQKIETQKAQIENKNKQFELDQYIKLNGNEGLTRELQEQLAAKLNLEDTNNNLKREKKKYEHLLNIKLKQDIDGYDLFNNISALENNIRSLNSIDSLKNDIDRENMHIGQLRARTKQYERILKATEGANDAEDEFNKATGESEFMKSPDFINMKGRESELKQNAQISKAKTETQKEVNKSYKRSVDAAIDNEVAQAEGEYIKSDDNLILKQERLENKMSQKRYEVLTKSIEEVNRAQQEAIEAESNKKLSDYNLGLVTDKEVVESHRKLANLQMQTRRAIQMTEDNEALQAAEQQRREAITELMITGSLNNEGHVTAADQAAMLQQVSVKMIDYNKSVITNQGIMGRIQTLMANNPPIAFESFCNEFYDGNNPLESKQLVSDNAMLETIYKSFNEWCAQHRGTSYG